MACLPVDPKNFGSVMSRSTQEFWPEIEYPDIFKYFIYTTISYTREQLKAYKSMDCCNFCSGLVRKSRNPGTRCCCVKG